MYDTTAYNPDLHSTVCSAIPVSLSPHTHLVTWSAVPGEARASGSLVVTHQVWDRHCDLVVRVPCYRSRDPGSIPGAIRFSEKWVWNEVHSASWVQLRSCLKENVADPV
jgi:hypothetical protein